ncbi:hypothetical protein [Luteolibacter luteus]|uniref:Uncharacterized protein n=1 Tax=Luteolibacter luteus TaxID=2728835 RepID=A0A858RLF5_9BACT|nr:hypothetical protein [Luteolibacter luteus]QJE98196.1 hypothetical protein HHL09_21200 [Luteolibacter luteus]
MTTRRATNLLGLSFLVVALVCLAVFHFLPGEEFEEGRGWRIWLEVWDVIRDPDMENSPEGMIGISCFVGLVGLMLVSPFLFGVLRKSRLAWWLVTIFSGLATMGLWVVLLSVNSPDQIGLSGMVLLAAPACNLIGLLLLRGDDRTPRRPVEEGNP